MSPSTYKTAPEETPRAARSLGGDPHHDSGDGRQNGSPTSTPGRKTTSRPRGYIEEYRPQIKTRRLLADVDGVLEEYQDHWPLTVRQVFYRLAGAHGHPKTEAFYSRLCHHLANARRGRWVPFEAIRDDGVSVVQADHYRDRDDFMRRIHRDALHYTVDRLARQDHHIEVWCEAAGMVLQLARVASHYSINVYSSSGFDSLTAKRDLSARIVDIAKPTVVLHLGDYDPSGEAIYTAAAEDVGAFVEADRDWMLTTVEFRRVALTEAQVAEYGLPTAPAKATDSRSGKWRGETCQLEAMAPDLIAEILEAAIVDLIDLDTLAEDIDRQDFDRRFLTHALPRGGDE